MTERMTAVGVLSCDEVAGEGDHAQHGGGGETRLGVWGRRLHRLTGVPLPRTLRYGRGSPTAGHGGTT